MRQFCAALLGVLAFAAPCLAQDSWTPDPGFRSLFNGKDLTGWHYKQAKEKLDGKTETSDKRFYVKDGIIVCAEGKGIKDLYTNEEFDQEFVLKVEFRAALKADSGVYVRGNQLQVRDFIRRGEKKDQLKKFKNDDWNQLEITVHNKVATLNGKILAPTDKFDVSVKDGVPAATLNGKPYPTGNISISYGPNAHCLCNGEFLEDLKVPTKGGIGLQAESGQFEYRRPQIKILSGAKASAPTTPGAESLVTTSAGGGTKKRLLLITESRGFVHSVVARPATVSKGVTVDQFPKLDGVEARLIKAKDPKKDEDRIAVSYNGRLAKPMEIASNGQVLAVVKPCLVEQSFMDLAAKTGLFDVDCSQNSRVELTGENLKNYDAVFFYTTGELPLSDAQKSDLLGFVKGGKGFGGSHCATDTFYTWKEYGELIGGYFDLHPWHTKIKVIVEDQKHIATKHLGETFEITDEIYQFKAPYGRDKLHVLMRVDPVWAKMMREKELKDIEAARAALPDQLKKLKDAGKIVEAEKLQKNVENRKPQIHRTDDDHALAWVHRYGKGPVFYTALGHREEVWQDPRFQQHVIGGLRYMFGMDK